MPKKRRVWVGVLLVVAALLLASAIGVQQLLQPKHATRLILAQAGKALGLDIRAEGEPEFQLRGTPRIVVRGVHARLPGSPREVLRAERILLSLPWRTLKSRGRQLEVERIELDAPVLDLAALTEWQRSRPPQADTRWPTLTRGLRVQRGQLLGEGWRVDGIGIELAHFAPAAPLNAQLQGRYLAPSMQLPFDLHLAMSKPANDAALGLAGELMPRTADWRLPIRLRLSAPLHWNGQALKLQPAKLGVHARYEGTGGEPLPFVIGAYGPAQLSKSGLDWPQLALALRGSGVVPKLDAQGRLRVGAALSLALDGRLPAWPKAWPTLPAPLGHSDAPLPFALRYDGALDFSGVLALRLQRDATRFDGRLRVRDVLAWREAAATRSPLPPIDGHLVSPRLEIGGAKLEGVEVDFEDPALSPAETGP